MDQADSNLSTSKKDAHSEANSSLDQHGGLERQLSRILEILETREEEDDDDGEAGEAVKAEHASNEGQAATEEAKDRRIEYWLRSDEYQYLVAINDSLAAKGQKRNEQINALIESRKKELQRAEELLQRACSSATLAHYEHVSQYHPVCSPSPLLSSPVAFGGKHVYDPP